MDSLQAQKQEFERLNELIKFYQRLPSIVDDSYPEARHKYEGALKNFIQALRENKKIGMNLAQLRTANKARNALWDPEKMIGLEFRALEFAGEAGEVANAVKKLLREQMGLRGSRVTVEDVGDELGDVLICLDLLAMSLDIDLETVVIRKFNKTSRAQFFDVILSEN